MDTQSIKATFLQALSEGDKVVVAAAKAGVGLTTLYNNWYITDPAFKAQWNKVVKLHPRNKLGRPPVGSVPQPHPGQSLFLQALRKTRSMQEATAFSGVCRQRVYKWAAEDPAFAKAWKTLKKDVYPRKDKRIKK